MLMFKLKFKLKFNFKLHIAPLKIFQVGLNIGLDWNTKWDWMRDWMPRYNMVLNAQMILSGIGCGNENQVGLNAKWNWMPHEIECGICGGIEYLASAVESICSGIEKPTSGIQYLEE